MAAAVLVGKAMDMPVVENMEYAILVIQHQLQVHIVELEDILVVD